MTDEKYTVFDVAAAIEAFAPLSRQEKWDNCGLQVGSPSAPVHSVLLGLDCTPELVDEAVSVGADMIVTHHPLIFGGLKKVTPEDSVGLALIKAVKAGISIYSAHTSADKVLAGVSGAMAERLSLRNVQVLDPEQDGQGLGAVGDLPSPVTAAEAVEMVRNAFNLKVVRTSRPIDGLISRVAVCGGSGSSLIPKAIASGAQLYLCGDISYHHFFTGGDFMLMDVGHYESEIDIVNILFSLIKKNFPTFAVRITENIYSNPIFYF